MGRWSHAWNITISAVRLVGNYIIKPTIKAVTNAVNWVENKIDQFYDSAKNLISKVKIGISNLAEGISNFFKTIDNMFSISGNINEVQRSLEEAQKKMDDTLKRMEALKEEIESKVSNEEIQTLKKANEQAKRIYELVYSVSNLKTQAERVKNEERMQKFDNFARLRVSTVFLEDIFTELKQKENIDNLTKSQLQFLKQVEIFITQPKMEDEELKQFDELVMEIYKKDLLQIGSELILEDYLVDYKEKKTQWQKATAEEDKLDTEVKKLLRQIELTSIIEEKEQFKSVVSIKEKERKAAEDRKQKLFEQKNLAEQYLSCLEALQYVANNQNKCTPSEIERAKDIGGIYTKYKNLTEFKFTDEDIKKINDFNDLALYKEWRRSLTEIQIS